jgi:hypothetical protein
MVKIGGRSLLAAHSLLIPKNERATIDLDIYGWKLQVGVYFDESAQVQEVQIKPVSEAGVDVIFKNWSNSLGTALVEPGALARLAAGGWLEFMASNYRIGETNKLDIQFLHNVEKQ